MSETTRPLHSRPVTGLSVGCGTAVLLTSLTASAALAAVQPSGTPQKEARDVVVVRGCVESGTLTSIARADGDATGDAAPGLTYRIAGPRALSKQLRREHEGHTEEITGRIKGEQAPRSTVRTKQMGKIGVVVGAAPGGAGPNAPRVPEMPSIEVEAFKHLENYCSPR
jgi:hypothetical protein